MFNDVDKVFSQFLWLHYLNGIPKRKDVLLEVIVWGEIVGEDAMVAVRFDLLLATVQRHQNKGDDNVRGHIGTELNHKAESILQIVRSKKDGNISEVHASYTRDREFKPFAFKIDAESRPVLVADYDFETNTARAVFDYECLSEEAHRAI